jgi:hypothetical protein
MISPGVNNFFIESGSPHSIGLANNMTVPSPGFDENPLIRNTKRFHGAGLQGCGKCGMGGLTFDGSGFLGTGLFSGDISTWGASEAVAAMIGAYAVYSMFYQAKQTKYRAQSAMGRRRKRRAKELRDKAKRLEDKGTSSLFWD